MNKIYKDFGEDNVVVKAAAVLALLLIVSLVAADLIGWIHAWSHGWGEVAFATIVPILGLYWFIEMIGGC